MYHTARLFAAAAIVLLATGCFQTRTGPPTPDETFGHRVEGSTDGRETAQLSPPDSGQTYLYFPAPHDSVVVRHAPVLPGPDGSLNDVEVEVLIKGAFPEACYVLHDVSQARTGNIVDVTLQMRKPQGVLCAQALRPYRFYLTLPGTYGTGSYTLKLNDRVHPFLVRASTPEQQ